MNTLKIPFILTLIAVLFGTGLGAFFGIQEKSVKNYLTEGISQNSALSAFAEPEKKTESDKLHEKSWRYVQRAHFHGSGIAAITLGLLLVLGQMGVGKGFKRLLGYGLSLSGLIYPSFWLLAGLKAPRVGASAAKASYEFLAYSGGAYVMLVLLLLVALLIKGFGQNQKSLA